jgi:flagellar protein FliT
MHPAAAPADSTSSTDSGSHDATGFSTVAFNLTPPPATMTDARTLSAARPLQSGADILATYASLSGLMDAMRAAALRGDWDDVTEIERDCLPPIDAIKAASGVRLTLAEQQQKLLVIKKILRDDAAIRDLVEPRMALLQSHIGATRSARASVQAYR